MTAEIVTLETVSSCDYSVTELRADKVTKDCPKLKLIQFCPFLPMIAPVHDWVQPLSRSQYDSKRISSWAIGSLFSFKNCPLIMQFTFPKQKNINQISKSLHTFMITVYDFHVECRASFSRLLIFRFTQTLERYPGLILSLYADSHDENLILVTKLMRAVVRATMFESNEKN